MNTTHNHLADGWSIPDRLQPRLGDKFYSLFQIGSQLTAAAKAATETLASAERALAAWRAGVSLLRALIETPAQQTPGHVSLAAWFAHPDWEIARLKPDFSVGDVGLALEIGEDATGRSDCCNRTRIRLVTQAFEPGSRYAAIPWTVEHVYFCPECGHSAAVSSERLASFRYGQ